MVMQLPKGKNSIGFHLVVDSGSCGSIWGDLSLHFNIRNQTNCRDQHFLLSPNFCKIILHFCLKKKKVTTYTHMLNNKMLYNFIAFCCKAECIAHNIKYTSPNNSVSVKDHYISNSMLYDSKFIPLNTFFSIGKFL